MKETDPKYRIVVEYSYYVIITSNKEKTILKTGVTADLIGRLHQLAQQLAGNDHLQKKDDPCYYLVYWESLKEAHQALNREKEINKLSVKRKKELIIAQNPDWQFLNDTLMIAGNMLLL